MHVRCCLLVLGVCLVVAASTTQSMAAQNTAVLTCTPERCVSSWTKTADGGMTARIFGSFGVSYKDYQVSGARGEFSQPPQGKQNSTTKLRAVVTESPRLAASGPDAFELIAGEKIDIELEDESIAALGGIRVTVKEAVITADRLTGGQPAKMGPAIEQAAADIGGDYAALITEWLAKAGPGDRLMLIEGDVEAREPTFTFTGSRLVVNSAAESYLFIGPHVLEMHLEEEEEGTVE